MGGRVVTVVTVVSVTGPRNGGGLFDCSAPTPRGFVRFYGHFGPHTSQDWLDFNCGTTQRGGECFSPHFGSLFFGGKSGSMQNPYMQCPQGSSLRCGFLRCGMPEVKYTGDHADVFGRGYCIPLHYSVIYYSNFYFVSLLQYYSSLHFQFPAEVSGWVGRARGGFEKNLNSKIFYSRAESELGFRHV